MNLASMFPAISPGFHYILNPSSVNSKQSDRFPDGDAGMNIGSFVLIQAKKPVKSAYALGKDFPAMPEECRSVTS
jgi:hypothetical protein